MRIDSTLGRPQHGLFHVNGINRAYQQAKPGTKAAEGKKNRDQATFSPQSKMMSLVENLNKQKEMVMEQRNKLVSKTLESGKKLGTITEQLDLYVKQLEAIDEQIANVYAQQARETLELVEKKKADQSSQPKTEEELEEERLSKLAEASDGIKQSQQIASVKTRMEGDLNVKESEAKISEFRVELLATKALDGNTNVKDMVANARRDLSEKRTLMVDLQDKIARLNLRHGEQLGGAREHLEQSNEAKPAKETEEADKSGKRENAPAEDSPEQP